MRTEKNIILIRHAKWLWDNKLKQESKECRKQAFFKTYDARTTRSRTSRIIRSSK